MAKASSDLSKLIDAFELVHAPVIAQVFTRLSHAPEVRDLSFGQMTAIMQVFLEGPQTISDIAEAADVSHYTASRMVDRLVSMEIFSRTEDPGDRRQKRVDLTKRGRSFPPVFRGFTRQAFKRVLSELPPEAIKQLMEVMSAVQRNLPPIPIPKDARRVSHG